MKFIDKDLTNELVRDIQLKANLLFANIIEIS